MLTYNESAKALYDYKLELEEEVAIMIKNKFYGDKYNVGFYCDDNDIYTLDIFYSTGCIIIKFDNYRNIHFHSIKFISDWISLVNRYNRIDFTNIENDPYGNYYSISVKIQNNILIDEYLSKQNDEYINKHMNLNYLSELCLFAYNKWIRLTSTHYLTHLKAARTLILVNKRMPSPLPFDVLKIIIEKI
jgi:hypothetical protein